MEFKKICKKLSQEYLYKQFFYFKKIEKTYLKIYYCSNYLYPFHVINRITFILQAYIKAMRNMIVATSTACWSVGKVLSIHKYSYREPFILLPVLRKAKYCMYKYCLCATGEVLYLHTTRMWLGELFTVKYCLLNIGWGVSLICLCVHRSKNVIHKPTHPFWTKMVNKKYVFNFFWFFTFTVSLKSWSNLFKMNNC